jgi:hypothetical protein
MDRYLYYNGRQFGSREAKDAQMREDIRREMGLQHLSVRKMAGIMGVSPTQLGLVLAGDRTSHTLLDDTAAELTLTFFDDKAFATAQDGART